MTIAAGFHIESGLTLLASHAGSSPDLVLTWNDMGAAPRELDVVLHLHGYSQSGAGLNIATEKLPLSGLDLGLCRRPTLGILPRGRFFGGRTGHGYDFPALRQEGAITALIDLARARFAEIADIPIPAVARRVLTAHSGGGAALMPVAAAFDPHEIHVFDALYDPAPALEAWVERAIEHDGADRALRILYIAGTGTQAASLAVAEAIERGLRAAPLAASRFRVEAVTADHGSIARLYGPILLADAAADLGPAG